QLNDVLTAMGGKWKGGKVQAHLFDLTPTELRDRIDNIINTGQYTNEKKLIEFYETPPDVAEKMVTLASLTAGDFVLEPSAGRGALAIAIKARARDLGFNLGDLIVVEPNEVNAARILRLMINCAVMTFESWLAAAPEQNVHKVIMNPPFRLACEHVSAAYDRLFPGGKLVAVMPSSIKFRNDRKYRELRERIESCGYIEDLPAGSFSSSGTNVNTCLVVMTA